MLLIHSKAADVGELTDFDSRAARLRVPLVAVPTNYPGYSAEELAGLGFRVVIYANQMLVHRSVR